MWIRIIAGTAIAALFAQTAMADVRTNRDEATGVGAGAAVGAVVGGPVGLIIGAAAGAVVGDRYHRKDEQVSSLSASLAGSRDRIETLEQAVVDRSGDIDRMAGELERLRATSRPELLQLLGAGIEMDLLFRTDEDVLADATAARLRQLAHTLAASPGIRLRLDGFADERGSTDYNQQLSLRRAEHVRDILVDAGIQPQRIELNARGESPAADDDIDSLALERRVSLTLYATDTPSFAANPD